MVLTSQIHINSHTDIFVQFCVQTTLDSELLLLIILVYAAFLLIAQSQVVVHLVGTSRRSQIVILLLTVLKHKVAPVVGTPFGHELFDTIALRRIFRVHLNIGTHEVGILVKRLTAIGITAYPGKEGQITVVIVRLGIHEVGHTRHLRHAIVAVIADGGLLCPFPHVNASLCCHHHYTCRGPRAIDSRR